MALDRNPLVTLHGRRLGLTKDGHMVCDEKFMAMNGNRPADRVVWYDDFLGDAILTPYNFQEGSDTAATFAIDVQKNGVARLATAASGTFTMAVNGAQVDLGALNWYAGNGGLVFEARVKCDAVTTLALFIGFTDQTSALEMPWTGSTVTYTSNQSDGCGFLYDTGFTSATIRAVGVKADTDVTNVDTSVVPVLAVYNKFRVEVDTAGTATYFIDGVKVATIANAVTTTVALVPVIAGFARAASVRNIDIDYWFTAQDRA